MLHRLCGIPNVRRGQAVGHGLYRVQARDEVGGRAEHMVIPRRAASATWNPQCEEGQGWGKR